MIIVTSLNLQVLAAASSRAARVTRHRLLILAQILEVKIFKDLLFKLEGEAL